MAISLLKLNETLPILVSKEPIPKIKMSRYARSGAARKKVQKVLMFVWRQGASGPEFLVLHRDPQKDCVVLTGHVEDEESLEDALKREIREELRLNVVKIIDLNFEVDVFLEQHNVLSQEHAFLAQVPGGSQIEFWEYPAKVRWCPYADLQNVLTYQGQKKAARQIPKFLK